MTVQPGDIVEMPCVTASRRFRETCLDNTSWQLEPYSVWLSDLWFEFEAWESALPLGDYVFPPKAP